MLAASASRLMHDGGVVIESMGVAWGVGVGWLCGSCQGIVVLQLMKCWSERIVALFGMALPLSLVRCGGRKGAQCILSVSE